VPAASVAVVRPLEPEDQARADFYALLARLFAAAPDAALLAAIAGADELDVAAELQGGATELATAWRALIAACAVMDPEAAAEEYHVLFVGVGASEVSLHGSTYAKAASGGPLLVQIREDLARAGLARQAAVTVYEDHLAAVCETMRMFIAGPGDRMVFPLAAQQQFFARNLAPWAHACCDAIMTKPVANLYRRVAQFADCFMALEHDSFAIGS
jgi:TorA maturation chaperone TorD